MGYYARVSADVATSTEHDSVSLAQEAPVGNSTPDALSGYVWRNGQAMPFTLEMTAVAPKSRNALPERIVIGALVLVSFAAPILHFLG